MIPSEYQNRTIEEFNRVSQVIPEKYIAPTSSIEENKYPFKGDGYEATAISDGSAKIIDESLEDREIRWILLKSR